MVKRRYGIINKKGIFNIKSGRYMESNYIAHHDIENGNDVYKYHCIYKKAYDKAFDYTLNLNGNIAIGLKNNKILCVWEMGNKDSTYKEFLI